MEADDAMDIVESMLPKTETRRDYEREDEMLPERFQLSLSRHGAASDA